MNIPDSKVSRIVDADDISWIGNLDGFTIGPKKCLSLCKVVFLPRLRTGMPHLHSLSERTRNNTDVCQPIPMLRIEIRLRLEYEA